ncbi:MAG: VanZ family protein [Euryarchaeota archaeon]|nr:VanZ family protein [Euryarchaeota archaeon]MBU4222187.1 VanZ family protein [Euryarchaeota archaeon]MCG2738476.1 VanZ family protein [Candidatus Methanoperedenaceae archaeon]
MSYAILIFYLSSQGPEAIPVKPLFPHQDKVMHFAEYVPFGWLSLKAFMPATSIGFVASMGFSLVYAASDEVHQSFVPGREMSIMDWLADAAGILISGYVYYNRVFRSKG